MIDKGLYQIKKQEIETFLSEIEVNKELLKNDFEKEKYYHKGYPSKLDSMNIEKDYVDWGAEHLINDTINYLKTILEVIDFIENKLLVDNKELSRSGEALLGKFNAELRSSYFTNPSHISWMFNNIVHLHKMTEYKIITYLKDIMPIDDNVVIVGKNGVGKTRLASILKDTNVSLITVIPAQKFLFYRDDDSSLMRISKDDIDTKLEQNRLKLYLDKNFVINNGTSMINEFSELLFMMVNEYTGCAVEAQKEDPPKKCKDILYNKLQYILSNLLENVNITLECNRYGNQLYAIKDEKVYDINNLSDGEKIVIYYTIAVLSAKQNSYIIVDEPELHLNTAIVNKLWDFLLEYRKDCQFIFITHSIEFVKRRKDAKLVWIEKFVYPDNWKYKIVDRKNMLPMNLLVDILGSTNPILFCEGNEDSLDYEIYNILFGKIYTILPVGGHNQVISYCNAVNNLGIGQSAKGIIDSDYRYFTTYSNDENIIISDFNEIEMLLIECEIRNKVLANIYPSCWQHKVNIFETSLWEDMQNNLMSIVAWHLKGVIEDRLSKEKIERCKTIEDVALGYQQIIDFDIEQATNKILDKISEIISKKNYRELLSVCNRKHAISRYLANKHLDSNYETKVIERLKVDDALVTYIRDNYFNRLIKL